MNIPDLYAQRNRLSYDHHQHDIWEHLPRLRSLAAQVEHVTEFGVRCGNSTSALLMGLNDREQGGTLIGYDIDLAHVPTVELPDKIKWQLCPVSTVSPVLTIAHTDLLLVDSCHDYAHVAQELHMHAGNVRRFLVMHDVSPFCSCGFGALHAMAEFLEMHAAQWKPLEFHTNCNGLAVLVRR